MHRMLLGTLKGIMRYKLSPCLHGFGGARCVLVLPLTDFRALAFGPILASHIKQLILLLFYTFFYANLTIYFRNFQAYSENSIMSFNFPVIQLQQYGPYLHSNSVSILYFVSFYFIYYSLFIF